MLFIKSQILWAYTSSYCIIKSDNYNPDKFNAVLFYMLLILGQKKSVINFLNSRDHGY